jgi:serine kinase of HPr protein (carbohydrate metabolism regulator)
MVAEAGVLLRGPSGAGKSDLALRLIDAGARLVADDYVEIECQGDRLTARPPAAIAGLIEVRGVGVIKHDYVASAPLDLIVDLAAAEAIERLPNALATEEICGLPVPRLTLYPWEISASLKVRLALQVVRGNIITL